MRHVLWVAVFFTACAVICTAGDVADVTGAAAELDVADFLQEISVTIKVSGEYGGGEGSGVIITRGEDNFVLTAGHVVKPLRKTRSVVDHNGSTKTVVEFGDARVVKELVENGRTVGRLELDAEVIRYSNSDNGHDLAVLKIRKKKFVVASAKFFEQDDLIKMGTPLFHVGSLLGEHGSSSMTSGIYAKHGRLVQKKVYDQTTVAAFPGSSGGGVYLTDGQYIGMIVRGSGETFNLIVPIRRIRKWAEDANVEWVLDPAAAMPSERELAALPIEDEGAAHQPDLPTYGEYRSFMVENYPYFKLGPHDGGEAEKTK